MELRTLKSADLWQMVRVLRKFDIQSAAQSVDRDLLKKSRYKVPTMMADGKEVPMPESKWTKGQKKAVEDAREAKDALTWQVLGILMENIGSCEAEVNQLLATGCGATAEEIRNMEANEYLDLIVQYFTREDFADFFMHAFDLLGKRKSLPNATTVAEMLTK